jgi:hypothetical protein
MKKLIFSILLPVALWAACKNKTALDAGAITGTYVNQAQSAYSTASDTLVIAQLNNAFTVIRKTGFRRITGGALQPGQHQSKTFTGTWDKDKQVLQLAPNGIILVFDGDKLTVQNSIYHKLPGGHGL